MTERAVFKRDEALFRLDGGLLVPGVLTKGPWYEDTLHGSAMLAAVARAAENHPSDVPRSVVRLTVDMMRAAPLAPLRVEAITTRAGKSIELVEIAIFAADAICVRATALRMRSAAIDVDEPDTVTATPTPPDGDDFEPPFAESEGVEPAFHHALDVHVDPSASAVWFRLAVPVVEGETNTSLMTVAAVADWTYASPYLLRAATGTGTPPDQRKTFAINADTTVNLHRPLSGDWVGLVSTTHSGPFGAATSSAHVFDDAGALGFTTQSILIRGPGDAPMSAKDLVVDD